MAWHGLEKLHLLMFATSSLLSCTGALEINSRSSLLGSALVLNMAAWARSAPHGRSKCPLELAQICNGARNWSVLAALKQWPADVSDFEPARLHWSVHKIYLLGISTDCKSTIFNLLEQASVDKSWWSVKSPQLLVITWSQRQRGKMASSVKINYSSNSSSN